MSSDDAMAAGGAEGVQWPESGWAPLTVILLAAGRGSRYGGLKQLERVGPGGATLLDYSLYDAWRSGFGRAVFVVPPEAVSSFEAGVGARYRERLEVFIRPQRLDDLPAGRVLPADRRRPWGTTQAVLAARTAVPGGFAVLNADDFYGRPAIAAAARFLETGAGPGQHATVAFRLEQTVSPVGGVNRAVLEPNREGALKHIEEVRDLKQGAPGEFIGVVGERRRRFSSGTRVSMNLWAMHPSIFAPLAEAFGRFLAADPGLELECPLPDSVEELISRGEAAVQIIPTSSAWCGLTHAEDRERVVAFLDDQVRRGEYPERPWE
ncbi:MAG TPA: NTP transferase domain-containing protein [Gemmatimonadales bacterium]|nr:NTP transferase domain-containing protein [Gemmatimonadales bacterium]